jgi:phenylacetate-CoA ligase
MFRDKYSLLLSLMRNERRTASEIEGIQTRKLRRLVRHAYDRVPFYRDLFRKAGVSPEDIRSSIDLERLPIIDKSDFRGRNQSELFDQCLKDKSRLIPVDTSGSSGVALRFYIDRSYDQFRKAQYLRPYLSNGRRMFDRVLRLMNTEPPPRKWFQSLGLMREEYLYSDSDLARQVAVFKRYKPTVLQGFGSSIGLLADRIALENTPFDHPRLIFTDSELLAGAIRKKIETVFQSRVLDVYGTFETDNIAYECDRHSGYHIASDCVVMEFLRDGKRVRPGEEGEIVCTVLDNFAMPFIRYNLHDIGIASDGPCACGRPFPIMKMIEGRSDDYAVYAGGIRKSPRSFLGLFDPLARFILEYRIVQGAIDRFVVEVVPGAGYSPEIGSTIERSLRTEFPGARVEIRIVSSIDRGPSNKLRAFVCNVGKGTHGG